MSLFGSSGIRGRVGDDITIDLVTGIGAAIGSSFDRVVIGHDPRTSTDMMLESLLAGTTSMGASVGLAGMVSTPTLARAAAFYDCGLMITASHNPPEYNGVKMWNPDGSAFAGDQMDEVEWLIEQGVGSSGRWDVMGRCMPHTGAVETHISDIMESVGTVDLSVVVDCGCGATCNITPRLMRELGCRVRTLNSQPDGHFPGRSPEPTEDQLGDLKAIVSERGADIGIAHDGDGDRMVAVDEKGRFVDGDSLLALFASRSKGGIATPINASMVLDEIVEGEVIRTRVGDVYVSDALKREGLQFGGEPSGTYIFSDQTYCPDGVYAAALLTSMVENSSLSEMVDELPSYPVARSSFSFEASRRREIESRLREEIKGTECDRLLTLDGYRAEFDDGWFLIRLSGTEPKIRITSEARERDSLENLDTRARRIVERCIS